MHELIDYRQGVNRAGYETAIWVCSCGRKGSGSLTISEAKAGWVKHARGRALREAGYAPARRRSRRLPDW